MSVPLSDRFLTRTSTVVVDSVAPTLIVAADPRRVSLVLCNNNGTKPLNLTAAGLGGADMPFVIPILSNEVFKWRDHGELVQTAWTGVGSGFFITVGVCEVLWLG